MNLTKMRDAPRELASGCPGPGCPPVASFRVSVKAPSAGVTAGSVEEGPRPDQTCGGAADAHAQLTHVHTHTHG